MKSKSSFEEATPPGSPEKITGNDDAGETLQEALQQCHLTPPTTSTPILTPPSSVGPEAGVSPLHTENDGPDEPYFDDTFQSAIRSAADTARKIAEVLGDCPRSEPTITTLKEEAGSLSSYRSPPSRSIGLIGHSGQGKSSLINSLLDFEELAITGESGNAVTAFVIEYKYKQESQTSRFLIEASCLKPEEIDEQLKELLDEYRQPFITACDDLTAEEYKSVVNRSEIAECIFEAAFSSIEGFSVESFKFQDATISLSVLQSHAKRLRWPQGMHDGEWSGAAQTVAECHDLTKPFVENGLWPFIQSMSVYLDSKLLRSGIILADLPGYHDVNYARVRNAQRYQSKCDELFVVADIKRAIDDPVLKEAIKNHTGGSNGVGEISSPNITVVCTHSASFTKSTQALKSRKNAQAIKQARAKIQSLESQNLGTGLETRRVLEEADLTLTSIFVQERNEEVKQALQKAYAKAYGPSPLPVYCVDNSMYLDYPDSLLAHAISGIPFLRRHTLSLPGKALFRFGDYFLSSHVPAIVLSLQMWLEASKGDQTCVLSGELVLEEWFADFDAAVDGLKKNAASAYKKSIKKPLEDRQREVISQASKVCDSWGWMHHSSFRAFVRSRGTHETRAVGYRCWNTELIDCLNAFTGHGWAEMDQAMKEPAQSFETLVLQAFQSMRKELTHAQAPASLLESLDHREEQVLEVLSMNFRNLCRNYNFLKRLATTGGSGSYVLEYMNPIYDRCSRDSGTGVTYRCQCRLESHISRTEFVTDQVHWAQQTLQHFVKEAAGGLSRDVTAIVSAIKADVKILESPSKTLVRRHPEYVQRLQETLDDAKSVAEEIKKKAEPARARARERGYIS